MLSQAREAEAAVLGAILLQNDVFEDVRGLLSPEHFDTPGYRAVYESILRLAYDGRPFDIVTLERDLVAHKRLGTAGGIEGLSKLTDRYHVAGNALEHAQIVRDGATRRRLRAIGLELADAAQSDVDVAAVATQYGGHLAALADVGTDGPVPIRVALDAVREDVRARQEGRTAPVPTGLSSVDAELSGGMEPGGQYVIGARPKMGKSAFAVGCGLAAAKAGNPVLVFSLEMSLLQLGRRVIASEGGVGLGYVKHPTNEGHTIRAARAYDRSSDLPVSFYARRATVDRIAAIARTWRRKNPQGTGVIVTDYIQLLDSDRRGESRAEVLGEMSRELKLLAVELGCVSLLLSQLNRNLENRDDKRPRLSDLRSSGAIEQDADAVMMLYRPHFYGVKMANIRGDARPPTPEDCEVIFAAQREGASATSAWVRFEGYYTRFVDKEAA